MPRYIVRQQKRKTVEVEVEAKNKLEAEEKVDEGLYEDKDVKEGEFFFPSEWVTLKVTRLWNKK